MNLDSPLLRIIILLLVGLALYSPVFDGQWVFDDERLVSGHDWLWRDWNGASAELAEWSEVLREGPREADEVRTGFRPIRFFSYRMDVLLLKWSGIHDADHPSAPIPFHVHNLLLHVLVACMLSSLVGRLFPWTRNGLHLAVALVFLVHPVQTEAVAWISGRRDVLFSLFYLFVLVGIAGQPLEKLRGLSGWMRGIGWAACGALAMSTKEMAATLPLVAAIMSAYSVTHKPGEEASTSGSIRRALRAHPAWLPMTAVVIAMTLQLLWVNHPGEGAERWGGSLWATFWTAGRAVVDYMLLVIAPLGLTVDYSYGAFLPSSGPLDPMSSLGSILALVGISAICLRYRSSPWAVLGWPLFFILLSPVLQWVPHPERFAERFLYLPMLAPIFLLVGFLRSLEISYPGWRQILIPVLIVLLALMTRSRLRDWEGPYPLWKSAVEQEPTCARARFGLAEAAREKGWTYVAVEELAMAIIILQPLERDALQQGMYLQALQIRAGLLASLSLEGSLIDKALEDSQLHWEKLLKEFDTDGTPVSDQPLPWFEKMKVDVRLSDDDSALECARRLLELKAALPEQKFEALMLISALGSEEESGASLADAKILSADIGGNALSRVSYQKGMLLLTSEKYEEALALFVDSENQLAEDGRASSALYRQAECQLQLGRSAAARVILEKLLDQEPDHLPSHLSLGELLLSAGEEGEAQKHFEAVLSVSENNPQAIQGMRQIAIRKRLDGATGDALPDPTRIATLTLLAERLIQQGEFEKAREALATAEKEAEGPAERDRRLDLVLRIARLDARLQNWAMAGEGYARLLDRTEVEDRGAFILEAVEVLRRTSGPSGAYEFLRLQEQEGVLHPGLRSQLGALADQSGNVKDAIQWYKLALEEDLHLSEARRVQLGDRLQILESGGDPQDPESSRP